MADPAGVADALRAREIHVDGPAPGRLEAAGGYSRAWQTVRIGGTMGAGLPFLIRHDTAGEERRRLLAGPVGLAPQPLGARRVAAVTIAVADLETALATYQRCFDLEERGDREDDAMLAARTATLPLPSGATIILASPHQPDHGPVAQTLAERGEGLFAITLAVDDLAGAVRTLRGRGLGVRVDEPDNVLVAAQLNHRQIHGARLGLVQAT
jgi:catechol 2,3-dioxygenase-like lactoylglutathione lyase family enzyme